MSHPEFKHELLAEKSQLELDKSGVIDVPRYVVTVHDLRIYIRAKYPGENPVSPSVRKSIEICEADCGK